MDKDGGQYNERITPGRSIFLWGSSTMTRSNVTLEFRAVFFTPYQSTAGVHVHAYSSAGSDDAVLAKLTVLPR